LELGDARGAPTRHVAPAVHAAWVVNVNDVVVGTEMTSNSRLIRARYTADTEPPPVAADVAVVAVLILNVRGGHHFKHRVRCVEVACRDAREARRAAERHAVADIRVVRRRRC
jgi:hypothetical protein